MNMNLKCVFMCAGNICPGMNDTIEAMVKRLGDYGVPEDNVMGIRWVRGAVEGKGGGRIGVIAEGKGLQGGWTGRVTHGAGLV